MQEQKYPLPILPLLPFLQLSPVNIPIDETIEDQPKETTYDVSTIAFIKACDTLSEACFKYAKNPIEADKVRKIFFDQK